MPDQFEQTHVVKAAPDAVYNAWIGGDSHAAMTGSPATSTPEVGGAFTAWNGFIWGTWQALEPGARIVMHWTTKAFPDGAPPSHVDVTLAAHDGGTRITIQHSNIPEGQGKNYFQGWVEKYFEPMDAHWG